MEEPFFTVGKIVGTKIGKNGVKLYKTRWEGYTPDDDTWEPLCHVAGTGHVDLYERKQRELTLSTYTPGVAVIEYDDGERQTIDLRQETFRSWMEDSDDERDDDSVTGGDDVNNFDLIEGGAMIELLWPHAQIFFSCKVISWTPILKKKDDKKSIVRHSSLVWKMRDDKKMKSEAKAKNDTSDVAAAATTQPSLAEGAASGCKKCQKQLETGEKTRKEHGDNCPRKRKATDRIGTQVAQPQRLDVKQKSVDVDRRKRGRPVETESATEDKSNDAPRKKRIRPAENDIAESAAKDENNDAPSKKRSRPGGEKEIAESATKNTSTDAPVEKRSRPGGEKESAEAATKNTSTAAPLKKKISCGKNDSAESAFEDKHNDATSKGERKSGEMWSAESAIEDESAKNLPDAPITKRSFPKKTEDNTTSEDSKMSTKTHIADVSDPIMKSAAQVKLAKGGEVVNGNSYAKKPKDVSDDDKGVGPPKVLGRTRNVSEDMTCLLSRKSTKQDTSTSPTNVDESLPDEMDIDALAVAVATKKSYPAARSAVQTATNSAASKDDASQLENDSDKNPPTEKVGRGVPLYSDNEYSSDDEGRGEREFFQPTSHPRAGPKLSFEEMWMMKLQRTQSIMDRNSGTRRW